MANLFSGITDFLSGGQTSDALSRLARSSDAIYDVDTPDLASLIPQLKLQVQQGTMNAADAQAAIAQLTSSMSPERAQAAIAQMTSGMEPAQAQAAMAFMSGNMDPAQAQTFLQSDSGMKNVQSDQQSLQGQRNAIAELENIGKNQGLTEADRAQYSALMNQSNAENARNRAAQIQQLQMQGNAGTGAELASRLTGVQGTANANAAAGAGLAQGAQARALAAIQAGLQGSANLNTQQFEQASKKAQAQDLINQFNAQAQNTIGLQNAQMAQQAGLANFNAGNQFSLANQASQNAANEANAARAQQSGALNFQTANQFNLANQAAQQAANEANAGRAQQAGAANFNAGNQFALANQANQQAANEANANRNQQANAANFGMANQIAGTNTGIQNQQAQLPYNAAQADFTNELNKAVAGSTADYRAGGVLADLAGKQADATSSGISNLSNLVSGLTGGSGKDGAGNLIGEGVKAIGNSDWWGQLKWDDPSTWFSDENLKTDKRELSDKDIDKIMGHMTGYQYRYKGQGTNPKQIGIMAQDMPRDSVIDTPAGKVVQKPEMLNQALAVLANQHERLKKLEGK